MLLLILASTKNYTLQRSPKSTNLISPVNASEEVGDNGRYVKKYKTSTIHLIFILNKTMAFKNLTVKYLHKEIEWEPRQQNVRKELHDVENSEHHPINKPLCVVLFVCTFHSFNPKKKTQRSKTDLSWNEISNNNEDSGASKRWENGTTRCSTLSF